MKRILVISIAILISTSFYSQNHSTINFIPTGFKIGSIAIYLNDQSIGNVNPYELFEYKVYSEGRIAVAAVLASRRYDYTIDIKNGETYNLLLEWKGWLNIALLEDEKKTQKYLGKCDKSFQAEEDIETPIGKIPKSLFSKRPSQGSGFLINDQGYVITNFHVIEDAEEITVKGINGDYSTKVEAKMIAVDRLLDLAIIQITSKLITFQSPPYALGSSSNMKQGESVFALGYPISDVMGLEIKVTDGIINSSTGFKGSVSEFQFSAAIQPGNSGGPLLNKNGEVIGIVSSKLSPEIVESAGYAIKSDYISFFISQVSSVQVNHSEVDLTEKELSEQVAILSDFVYIIETK